MSSFIYKPTPFSYIYEGKSKIIRTFIFMDYFKNTKHENDLSFFYIISTHFDALVPAVYKLINAI